jgi:hypothetical protein
MPLTKHANAILAIRRVALAAGGANRAVEETTLAVSAHAPPVLAPEKLWQLLVTTVSGFRAAISDWTYRPKAHYMRGPGPKSLRNNSDNQN